jgi:hypothetical protein
MEYEPHHIKHLADSRESEKVNSAYLDRHKVSMAQLDTWQINVVSDAAGDEKFPKLNWTEIADVANRLAFHWNTQHGRLCVYAHYYEAVKNACAVVMSKRKTETIVAKVLDEKEIDEKYNTPWNDR